MSMPQPVVAATTGRPRCVRRRRLVAAAAGAAAIGLTVPLSVSAYASPAAIPSTAHGQQFKVFAPSFVEDPATHTVRLPLYTGTSGGSPVSFVVTDASTKAAATLMGVNWAPRLANARGTAAVQKATFGAHGLEIPATVDFSPNRVVVPGPTGFPPKQAVPGAVGRPGYSPLIQLPDGTVLNAPQVANNTGHADKLVSTDAVRHRAVYRETDGFYDGHAVHYVSFEASIPLTAALENAALAPALNAAPPDDPRSTADVNPAPAREEIGIVTNGQLGVDNPQRQGLSSALLDGLDPLNILGEVPANDPASHYSPLWDANLATWTPQAVSAGQNRRVTTFDDLLTLADRGLITAPDGGPFRRSDFLINCPAISIAQ
jgi:hypothetical protein